MNILLVFTFILKLLARTNLFTNIREKHGLSTLHAVRNYERLLKREAKIQLDLKFLLTCKKEGLSPTFARPKLSIKETTKLRNKITKIIIETEIANKHQTKKKIKDDLLKS
jgi:hypothetical protein